MNVNLELTPKTIIRIICVILFTVFYVTAYPVNRVITILLFIYYCILAFRILILLANAIFSLYYNKSIFKHYIDAFKSYENIYKVFEECNSVDNNEKANFYSEILKAHGTTLINDADIILSSNVLSEENTKQLVEMKVKIKRIMQKI